MINFNSATFIKEEEVIQFWSVYVVISQCHWHLETSESINCLRAYGK